MSLLPELFRWHRRIGLLVALPVLLWTLSGVLHPIMSRLNPQPVSMMSPAAPTPAPQWLLPAEILRQAQLSQLQAMRLVSIGGQNYYQVRTTAATEPLYFNVLDGTPLAQGARRHAIELALHFSGRKPDTIKSVTRITRFDDDYLWINRLLPVWRIDFTDDDQLAVYVETAPARLGAMVDNTKRLTSTLFRTLHNWETLPQHPIITLIMTVLLILAALMGIGGIILYGWLGKKNVLARRQKVLQRWHRRLGIGISLFACLFAFSGAWHLLHDPSRSQLPESSLPVWNTTALASMPAHRLWGSHTNSVIIGCGASACRLITPRLERMGEHQHHATPTAPARFELLPIESEVSATPILFNQATEAARQALSLPTTVTVEQIETITTFAGEYGFLNKRLPVMKIRFTTPDAATAYWEPGTGMIAAVIRTADRLEGFSFGYLHKFHWLDAAGKNLRDSFMALMALLLAIVTLLGVIMGWRKTFY